MRKRCPSCLARIARNSGSDGPETLAWSNACTCDPLRQENHGPGSAHFQALADEVRRTRTRSIATHIEPDEDRPHD